MKTLNRRVFIIRRIVLLLILCAVAVGVVLAVLPAQAAEESASDMETITVTVEEDESLWNIAREHSGGHGTAELVEQVKKINGLSGSVVHPGQELEVPTR